MIDYWIKQFEIKKISDRQENNEIMNLLSNYDLSELRIINITFDPKHQEDEEYLYFGFDINDRLVLNKNNGKIFSFDPFGDRIVFACAENSHKFLDALFEIMQFSKEKMMNMYTEEIRDEKSSKIAYVTALKAGGEEYYKSILWVE